MPNHAHVYWRRNMPFGEIEKRCVPEVNARFIDVLTEFLRKAFIFNIGWQ